MNPVDEYIATQPETVQATLCSVRASILNAIPSAQESIAYKMPTYKLNGVAVLYFAGWKRHYSLYPIGDRLVQEFTNDFARYEIKGSTLRLPLSEPVPTDLIERIAKFRASEVAERD